MARLVVSAIFTLALTTAPAFAQSGAPPRTWVDKDTGHWVIRLTDEPGSSGFYFNVNAYTPDNKTMVFTAPDGIHVMDMASRKTRLLVANPPSTASSSPGTARSGVHAVVVGHKTNSVFYTQFDAATKSSTIYSANTDTGAVTKYAALPPGVSIASINADETLAAATMNEKPTAAPEYGANRVNPPGTAPGPLVQPQNKGEMMEQRLAARTPLILFTINLQTGKMTTLLHSTDWVNHLLFSPTDPTLLMYCHEGP